MLIGHCNAKETMTQKIILKVKRFVDGDGLIAEDYYLKESLK
jgi:hypothetical protein